MKFLYLKYLSLANTCHRQYLPLPYKTRYVTAITLFFHLSVCHFSLPMTPTVPLVWEKEPMKMSLMSLLSPLLALAEALS